MLCTSENLIIFFFFASRSKWNWYLRCFLGKRYSTSNWTCYNLKWIFFFFLLRHVGNVATLYSPYRNKPQQKDQLDIIYCVSGRVRTSHRGSTLPRGCSRLTPCLTWLRNYVNSVCVCAARGETLSLLQIQIPQDLYCIRVDEGQCEDSHLFTFSPDTALWSEWCLINMN